MWAHIHTHVRMCIKLHMHKLVYVSTCVCCEHQRNTAHGSESTVCVCVLLEMCHVCDKLTLIRQSHQALGVCLWLHMSDVATGAVMTQS